MATTGKKRAKKLVTSKPAVETVELNGAKMPKLVPMVDPFNKGLWMHADASGVYFSTSEWGFIHTTRLSVDALGTIRLTTPTLSLTVEHDGTVWRKESERRGGEPAVP